MIGASFPFFISDLGVISLVSSMEWAFSPSDKPALSTSPSGHKDFWLGHRRCNFKAQTGAGAHNRIWRMAVETMLGIHCSIPSQTATTICQNSACVHDTGRPERGGLQLIGAVALACLSRLLLARGPQHCSAAPPAFSATEPITVASETQPKNPRLGRIFPLHLSSAPARPAHPVFGATRSFCKGATGGRQSTRKVLLLPLRRLQGPRGAKRDLSTLRKTVEPWRYCVALAIASLNW